MPKAKMHFQKRLPKSRKGLLKGINILKMYFNIRIKKSVITYLLESRGYIRGSTILNCCFYYFLKHLLLPIAREKIQGYAEC